MTTRILSTSHGTNRAAFHSLDWALLVSAAAIWGSSFLFTAIALEAFRPGLVTLLRVGFGALALNMWPGARRPVERADWPRLWVVALLWVAIPLTLFPIAQQWIASGVTGMLNGFTPVLTAVVASFLLSALPGARQRWGLGLGLVGVAAIGLPTASQGRTAALGVVLVLAALLCYAFAINLVAPLQQKYGAVPVLARVVGVAVLVVAPLGGGAVQDSYFAWGPFLANFALGALGTGAAFVAATTLIGRVGSTRGSTLTYLIPVVALFLGIVFRDERVEAVQVMGTALVMAGAFLTSRRER